MSEEDAAMTEFTVTTTDAFDFTTNTTTTATTPEVIVPRNQLDRYTTPPADQLNTDNLSEILSVHHSAREGIQNIRNIEQNQDLFNTALQMLSDRDRLLRTMMERASDDLSEYRTEGGAVDLAAFTAAGGTEALKANVRPLSASLAYLEETFTKEASVTALQDIWGEIEETTTNSRHYSNVLAFYEVEHGAAKVIRRSYRTFGGVGKGQEGWWSTLTKEERSKRNFEEDYSFPMQRLETEWSEDHPTFFRPTSDGAIAIWVIMPDGSSVPFGSGLSTMTDMATSPRERLDETTGEMEEYKVLGDKFFKRLSLDGMSAWLHMEVAVAEYGTPEALNPDADTFVYELREEAGLDHDGVVYISPRLRKTLVRKMVERILDGRRFSELDTPTKVIIRRVAKKAMQTITFGSFRGLTDIGLFKGDGLVVVSDRIPEGVDMIVYADNHKKEIRHRMPNTAIITMMAKKQGKSIKTNRQVISFLGDLIYGDNYDSVVNALERKFNLTLAQLQKGQYRDHASLESDPDPENRAFASIAAKVEYWGDEAGLPVEFSRYLTEMLAEGVVRQHTPDEEQQDRKRKFPVPGGIASSMHTVAGYELVYGKKCPVKPGHVLHDAGMGWIPARDIQVEFFGDLGGADRDDIADAVAGFSDCDDAFWGVRAGQETGIFYRNPLTANSNGEISAKEFNIRPIQGLTVKQDSEGNRAIILPDGRTGVTAVLPVSRRPLSVRELEVSAGSFSATPLSMPERYLYNFAMETVKNNDRDPLGKFINILMAYSLMGWGWEQIAPGEEVVDACQQLRNPDDFRELDGLIKVLKNGFYARMLSERRSVEAWVLRRIGLYDKAFHDGLVAEDGVFTSLIARHTASVDAFKSASELLGDAIIKKMVRAFQEYHAGGGEVMRTIRNAALRPALAAFEAITGIKEGQSTLSESNRQLLGDLLGEKLEELANNMGRTEMLSMVREYFIRVQVMGRSAESRFPERHLYWGAAFYILVESLKGEDPGDEQDGNDGNPVAPTPKNETPFREVQGNFWALLEKGRRAYGSDRVVGAITTNGVVKQNGAAVMGRGIAQQARDRFSGIDRVLGGFLTQYGNRPFVLLKDEGILSMPVKEHWKDNADLAIIKSSAKALVEMADKFGWEHILVVRPGTGNGKLRWRDVKPVLESVWDDRFIVVAPFEDLPVEEEEKEALLQMVDPTGDVAMFDNMEMDPEDTSNSWEEGYCSDEWS